MFEVFGSGSLLPLIALGLLYFQLSKFGAMSAIYTGTIAMAAFRILCFGLLVVRNVSKIKDHISKLSKQTPETDERVS